MATRKAAAAATTQPAAPAKVQTPPISDNIAAVSEDSLDTRLANAEREYAGAVASVGRLGDVLRELRAELAAERS